MTILEYWRKLLGRRPVPPPSPPTPPGPAPDAGPLLFALNARRVARGLVPLAADPTLDALASTWAARLAFFGSLDHGDFAGRLRSVYPGRAGAENLAAGPPTAEAVADSWMGSPGHRANLLGPFTAAGVGRATARDGTISWVVDFVR